MNSEISSAGADHHPCMEMETYQHLAERYSLVLERAKKYLSKERKHRSGGTISDTRKQALLEAGAECPMCGDQFRDRSFNTEHIHSRCLGGEKSCNDNRTAICIPCNNAKNRVMQRMLPYPDSKYQPSCWPMVEGYLLWSELTTDEGLAAGALVPEAHAFFLEARFADEPMLNHRVQRAFGRFSTWEAGDAPNFSCNLPDALVVGQNLGFKPTPIPNHHQSLSSEPVAWGAKLRSIARGFFDRLFDYSPNKAVEVNTIHALDLEDDEPLDMKLDTLETYARWQQTLDIAFEVGQGSIELRFFWEMVSEERRKTHLSWKMFERKFGVNPKRNMPMKAAHYLNEMNYNFTFQRGDGGYNIILLNEEE